MTEYDREAKQLIENVRKGLKELVKKVSKEYKAFPEILDDHIKSLISAKLNFQLARNRDSELIVYCEKTNRENFNKGREEEAEIIQEIKKPKKKRISYTRV